MPLGIGLTWSRLPEAAALLGRSPNLTGRLELWSAAVSLAWSRPWLGYGYGAFWSSEPGRLVAATVGWVPLHAHNGYLDVWLSLGFPGLALVAALFLLSACRAFQRARRERGAALGWWAVVGLLVVANASEAYLVGHRLPFVLLVAAVARPVVPAPRGERDAQGTDEMRHKVRPERSLA